MEVIGIDLGGTKSAAAIFNENGKILAKDIATLDKRGGNAVGQLITRQIEQLLQAAAERGLTIAAVGITIPGIYHSKTGCIWAPNIPGWDNYPLLAEMRVALSGSTIEIKIDSDRAAYILGETWLGTARGCKDAIFVAVGTGIGAGILVDGRILRGHGDIAGATGWMGLDRPFMEKYIPCGCFEYHASGEGLARVAREFLGNRPDYHGELRSKALADLTAKDVFCAYDSGDPLAKDVLNMAIEFWGMAVANYVSLFNPEKIIFGGGVFGPAIQFLDRIKAEARKWAQPISINQVTIEASALGSNAGLIGAGRLAMLAVQQ